MANFSRVRDTGMWTVSVLLPSELEKFDANLFKAPNFADGGTYAPSGAITVGGAGFVLTTPFQANGTTSFGGLVTFGNGAAFVHGSISIQVTLDSDEAAIFRGNFTLGTTSADTLAVYSTATFQAPVTITDDVVITSGKDLAVGGTLTVTGATTLGATTIVNAPATFNSGVTLNQAVTLSNKVTPGIGAYIKKRFTSIGSDDQLVSIEDYDLVRVTSATTLRVDDYGDDGATIRVINTQNTSLSVKTPGGVTLKSLLTHTWVDLMRATSATYGWHSIGEGPNTDIS